MEIKKKALINNPYDKEEIKREISKYFDLNDNNFGGIRWWNSFKADLGGRILVFKSLYWKRNMFNNSDFYFHFKKLGKITKLHARKKLDDRKIKKTLIIKATQILQSQDLVI